MCLAAFSELACEALVYPLRAAARVGVALHAADVEYVLVWAALRGQPAAVDCLVEQGEAQSACIT